MVVARSAAVLAVVEVVSGPAVGLPGIFDLGVLDVPGQLPAHFQSHAMGVSADGTVVVGQAHSRFPEETYPRSQAFRWENGVMQGLGPLVPRHDSSAALGASADGSVVVGYVRTETAGNTDGGFVWDESGVTVLTDVPGGQEDTGAFDVSSDGGVVVGYGVDAQTERAARWDLGIPLSLGSGSSWSYAFGIDGDGSTAVGMQQPWLPLRWDGAVAQALPLPPGMLQGAAEGISSDGTVIVGWSRVGPGADVATHWDASGAALLGTLPGDARSQALEASGDGSVVVGWSESAAGTRRAFVWDALSGMRALRDVLEDDYGFDLTGWTPAEATGISDDGTVIVGVGATPTSAMRAWIAQLGGNGAPACSNGVDDDGDGVVDGADPGCASALDISELSHLAQCDDGLDNDADGDVDFPADPGCTGLTGSPEGTVCDDDLDNDRDGKIDWDGGSGGAPADPRCAGNPLGKKEQEPLCGLGFEAGLAVAAWAALRRRRSRPR